MLAPPAVILTREPEDNAALASLLAARGLRVVQYPCIVTRVLGFHPSQLPAGLALSDFDVLAFTSRRGVVAVPPDVVAQARRARIAAVGPATAAAIAQSFSRPADVISTARSAAALAEELLRSLSPGARVLLFRGDLSVGSLQETLLSSGISVVEAVVYRNEAPELHPVELDLALPAPERLVSPSCQGLRAPDTEPAIVDHRPSPIAVVVLSSPSIAERFFAANPDLVATVHPVAFGKTTADRIRDLGCPRVWCPVTQDAAAVSTCIVNLLSEVSE